MSNNSDSSDGLCRNRTALPGSDMCGACRKNFGGYHHVMLGYYSAMANAKYGSVVYPTPTGGSVRVTAIYDIKDSINNWPDLKLVGEVLSGPATGYYDPRKK